MNGTVAAISARALLGRRRFLLLLPLPVLLLPREPRPEARRPPTAAW
ncbi:MAG TPA: hypothetical protein VMU51_07240 [Mycobacteriales bacterium]|nr:hypothetical protein [Mycobacteriales bacterium]